MPCSDESYEADDADESELQAGQNGLVIMCVPINNIAFYDPANTTPIASVNAGQPFVARVYIKNTGNCQGTQINFSYTLHISNAPADALAVTTLIVQVPTNPAQMMFQDCTTTPPGLYFCVTITPNTLLSGTPLTVTGATATNSGSVSTSIPIN